MYVCYIYIYKSIFSLQAFDSQFLQLSSSEILAYNILFVDVDPSLPVLGSSVLLASMKE